MDETKMDHFLHSQLGYATSTGMQAHVWFCIVILIVFWTHMADNGI